MTYDFSDVIKHLPHRYPFLFVDKIVSVDVPSGIGTKHSVVPDVTITFHDYKMEMNEENSGIIILNF